MLINAVKDVASALGDLIQATKAASGKSINDPSMNHLKDSAKVRASLKWYPCFPCRMLLCIECSMSTSSMFDFDVVLLTN